MSYDIKFSNCEPGLDRFFPVGREDVTIFFRASDPHPFVEPLKSGVTEFAANLTLPDGSLADGRVCLVRCGKEHLSATLRFKRREDKLSDRVEQDERHELESLMVARDVGEIKTATIVEHLWKLTREPTSGLVIFCGGTNSAKSDVAKAFCLYSLLRKLESRIGKDPLPHLVTYEDPVEAWNLWRKDGVSIRLDDDPWQTLSRYGICVTAQGHAEPDRIHVEANLQGDSAIPSPQCHFVCKSRPAVKQPLVKALQHAKRQTPTCFFVGEIRRNKEWKAVLEFAGSGHLIVVTTHAGSVEECLSRILVAAKANHPSEVRNVASPIKACIHQRKDSVKLHGGEDRISAVFPSVWINQGQALASLVADGLDSVKPNDQYFYSRHQFVQQLSDANATAGGRKYHDAIVQHALDLDLKEMCLQ